MFLAVPVCHYSKRIAVRLRTASVSPRIVVRSFSDAVDAVDSLCLVSCDMLGFSKSSTHGTDSHAQITFAHVSCPTLCTNVP